jgi:hypothetical protein
MFGRKFEITFHGVKEREQLESNPMQQCIFCQNEITQRIKIIRFDYNSPSCNLGGTFAGRIKSSFRLIFEVENGKMKGLQCHEWPN